MLLPVRMLSRSVRESRAIQNRRSLCEPSCRTRSVAVVLDADGLNAFEGASQKLDGKQRPLVLTPHPGEMARLVGLSIPDVQRDRVGIARSFTREHNCILVLKGHRTLIAAPDGTVWVNTTGNPGMAKGGSAAQEVCACGRHPADLLGRLGRGSAHAN